MGRKCFVMMPFAASFQGIWEHVLRPTVTGVGDDCKRGDDIFAPGLIMDDVIKAIREADYLIADLTGRNPNVYYELGYAHSLGKPVILLTQRNDDVPFDLRHHRLIQYDDTAAGAVGLRTMLQRYIESLP
jgi:Nucleoside 2-deoxyribosyltransferase